MERETGFYWIRLNGNNHWEIAYWSSAGWHLIGDEQAYDDTSCREINETRILPPNQ